MAMSTVYATVAPTRDQIDAQAGPAVLEFGTSWCGFCRAAQPLIAEALETQPQISHFKIEDGPGRPLGRSFCVKLWPTLIFLKDGKELAQLVRPQNVDQIKQTLAQIA